MLLPLYPLYWHIQQTSGTLLAHGEFGGGVSATLALSVADEGHPLISFTRWVITGE